MKKLQSQAVQLEGKELKAVRTLGKSAERDIVKLANRTLTHLYGDSHRRRIKALLIFPNNTKVLILDAQNKVVGVWQDPPGVCRKATKKEQKE